MGSSVPHIVQYQGSKRMLAPQIIRYIPQSTKRLIEPFSGIAAITIAASQKKLASSYHINDVNQPLIEMIQTIVETPEILVKNYAALWNEQFDYEQGHVQHFYEVRQRFNSGDKSPENMLYLLARCVKGAVRYNDKGEFNQSPDKRRHGINPKNISKSAAAISSLLKGRTTFSSVDYHEILECAERGDVLYMDPPYQGVSQTSDPRYFAGVLFDDFSHAVAELDKRKVNYLISYDGTCGNKKYGRDLPLGLDCSKFLLNAGLSTQSTLLGKSEFTFEALYVSNGLLNVKTINQIAGPEQEEQRELAYG